MSSSLRLVIVASIFSLFFLTSLLAPLCVTAQPMLELNPVKHDITPLSKNSTLSAEVVQDEITISGKTDPSAQLAVKKTVFGVSSESSASVSSDGSFSDKVTFEVGPGFTQGVEEGDITLSVTAVKGSSTKQTQVPLANTTSDASVPELVGAALNAGVEGYPHTFVVYNNPWFFYTGRYINDAGTVVQTSKDEVATQLAKFSAVSLHYTDDASSIALIKQKNPAAKVFAYINPMFCYRSSAADSEYQQVVKKHPEWFLYPDVASRQSKTNPIVIDNEQVMDLTTGWRDEAIKLSKAALTKGFDGLYIDCICDDPSLCYGSGSNTAPSGNWHTALNTYLEQVRVAGKLNFYNGQCPLMVQSNQDFLDRTEGWMDEGFISYKGWQRSAIDMPQYAAAKNKFTMFYASNKDVSARHFYFTSALLSDGYFFYSLGLPYDWNTQWYSDYGTYIGDPLGQAYKVSGLNGVWARDYTAAKVIVNPTSSSVTTKVSGYTDLSGKALTSVTIGPNDGVIVKKRIASAPAVTSWGPGRLDVFAKGTDGTLWHQWFQGGVGWSKWESLGKPLGGVTITSDPTAVSWGLGRIDVCVRGSDGQLWQLWYANGIGWRWYSLGAPSGISVAQNTAPSVASWGTNRLDIFVVGSDGQLWQKWWNGQWHWTTLGKPSVTLQGSPGALSTTSWGYQRVDIAVRGSDGALWQKWYRSGWGWQSWYRFGDTAGKVALQPESPATYGAYSYAPAVVSGGANRLDVFYVDTGGHLQQKYWDGSWKSYAVGGTQYISASPSAVAWTFGTMRYDIFIRGADFELWQKYFQYGRGWSGWIDLGGINPS